MEHVPWTVVYGAWVWKLALVAMIAGAAVHTWARPRRAARRRWRQRLEALGDPVSPEVRMAGERVTISGRLAAEGACARFEDGAEVAATGVEGYGDEAIASTADLAVETDGGTIDLGGPIELAAGSGESRAPGDDPRLLAGEVHQRIGADLEGELVSPGELIFASLKAGDRVRARGQLALAGAADSGGYRDSGHRFTLADVTLASEEPPEVRGPRPSAAIRPVLLAGVAFLLIFGLGGEIAYKLGKDAYVDVDEVELAEAMRTHRASRVAAMTPFRRDRALGQIHSAIRRAAPSVATREALVAMARLRGHCAEAARERLSHRQFRRAVDSAQGCDAARTEAIARFALGDLEGASEAFGDASSDTALRVHLLAGAMARAAAAARRRAASYREPSRWTSQDPEARQHRARIGTAYECLAAAIDARAGDRGRVAAIEAAAAEGSHACRLLLADLAGGAEADALLEPWPPGDFLGSHRLEETARWLYLSRAPAERAAELLADDSFRFRLASDHAIRFARGGHFHGALPQLVLARLEAATELDDAATRLRDALLSTAAMEEAFIGNFDRARQMLEGAGDSKVSELDPKTAAAFVELRAGELAAARAALADASDFLSRRLGALIEALEERRLPRDHHLSLLSRAALEAALRGDGAALEAELREEHFHPPLLSRIAVLAPWLPPEPLAAHLEYARHISDYGLTSSVETALGFLADRAHVARVVGADDHAAVLDAGIARIREANGRRDIAVFLAVIDAL